MITTEMAEDGELKDTIFYHSSGNSFPANSMMGISLESRDTIVGIFMPEPMSNMHLVCSR